MAGDDPDVIAGCTGGSGNVAGIAFPFLGLQLRGGANAKRRRIPFNRCGHGHFDMAAYADFFAGQRQDLDCDEAELAMALVDLPRVPA
ncbi:hypothetical protein [Ideonella livida]|uniref:Uncharacterized protein n=1 Tax=Ideonella livida TaxID=2707176 RepID=A0A7C9PHT0_9BURK|nr:hypothetical protein [Ideonella livida]NDY91592.1 hypothetical protein [Ideonella livida]